MLGHFAMHGYQQQCLQEAVKVMVVPREIPRKLNIGIMCSLVQYTVMASEQPTRLVHSLALETRMCGHLEQVIF